MPDPVAPAPAAPTTPAAPAAPAMTAEQVTAEIQRLEGLRAEHSKAAQELETQRRKHAADVRNTGKERQTWAEKLKAADEFAKLQKNAKLNPEAVAKQLFGENYYDTLTNLKISGGAPAADVVAVEIERIREESKKDLEAFKEELRTEQQTRETQAAAQARAELVSDLTTFAKDRGMKDFPALKVFGDEKRIGEILATRVEQEFRTSKRMLTNEQVSELVEAELVSKFESVVGEEKYRPKFESKLKPSSSQPVAPKSLSNDLTAKTPAAKPTLRRDEREHMKQTLAKYSALRSKA